MQNYEAGENVELVIRISTYMCYVISSGRHAIQKHSIERKPYTFFCSCMNVVFPRAHQYGGLTNTRLQINNNLVCIISVLRMCQYI